MFEKTQHLIAPDDCIRRQHAIPDNVRLYAARQQLNFSGSRGRGRINVATLADIYYGLIAQGLKLVQSGTVKPTFKEIGRPEGCTFTQIKFDLEIDAQLRNLKEVAEAGEFEVVPYKSISLISLAVNLMDVAIEHNETTQVQTKPKRKRNS